MKKINFTCPHCGGHKLVVEQPLQWIQLNVLGFDDEGDLMLDHNNPSIVDDDNSDYEIYCKNCFARITEQEISEQNKKKIPKEGDISCIKL